MDHEIEELHRIACAAGQRGYRDPRTGLTVFTELAHLGRGRCCGNGCRHCPYAHVQVANPAKRKNAMRAPLLLRANPPTGLAMSDVLFYSGGKDSYLTARRHLKALAGSGRGLVLLTTCSGGVDGIVGHQQIPFRWVAAQAQAMRLDLLGVPLDATREYPAAIAHALSVLTSEHGIRVNSLVFGDLHVALIRAWREANVLTACGLGGVWPVWSAVPGANYAELERELLDDGAEVRVCALGENLPKSARALIFPGAKFDGALCAALRARQGEEAVDVMGELGEFHSFVIPAGFAPALRTEVLSELARAAAAGQSDVYS
ncbi:hypothetical protein T492DRAFT_1063408 [Pavlovales sp. CCMP2436]|nr:hypothetical protein T492DRAFT_1063408 [Pavlovales sp. CCMP2436]|mmetsp:Transcript_12261/g.30909  ORF Transcript_12261/g.30909 Transcript_12261/m.30909 type:complete len:317 (-) Transcript_12261:145-1095(-)